MSDELVKILRSTYHATTPRKINTISSGQMVAHTAAPTVVYRNPDGPAAADRIEALTAEVKRLDRSTNHTCWDECPRVVCMQRRKIDALTAQLAEAREEGWNAGIEAAAERLRASYLYTAADTKLAFRSARDIIRALAMPDPVRDTKADSDGDDGA